MCGRKVVDKKTTEEQMDMLGLEETCSRRNRQDFNTESLSIDQVVMLTQNIENSFVAIKKVGTVYVNLTAV